MGLDWIAESKPRNENVDVKILQHKISACSKEIEDCWVMFCSALDKKIPVFYPNDLHDEFMALESTKEMVSEIDALNEQLSRLYISPAETLGAPRIGIDKAAESWIDANLKSLSQDGSMTKEEFIEKNRGQYLVEALGDECEGLGSITGIMAGPTSFRGKVIGYVDWLPSDIKERAYKDHSPKELEDLGKELEALAEAESGEPHDSEKARSVKMVKSAAKWCMFWGSRGHPMHAWFLYLILVLGESLI